MYCCSKKSGRRTVHTDACYHIRPIAKTDLTWFATTEEALQEGRRLCRDCCPIVRFVEEDMAELTDYCRKHSSHIFLHSQYIGVRTPCGSWRIGLNAHKSGLSLYHKNVRPAKKKQTEPIPGYHLQNTRQRSVRD